jgi:hypothetical protein
MSTSTCVAQKGVQLSEPCLLVCADRSALCLWGAPRPCQCHCHCQGQQRPLPQPQWSPLFPLLCSLACGSSVGSESRCRLCPVARSAVFLRFACCSCLPRGVKCWAGLSSRVRRETEDRAEHQRQRRGTGEQERSAGEESRLGLQAPADRWKSERATGRRGRRREIGFWVGSKDPRTILTFARGHDINVKMKSYQCMVGPTVMNACLESAAKESEGARELHRRSRVPSLRGMPRASALIKRTDNVTRRRHCRLQEQTRSSW